jgi:hypothetical protein
VAKVRPGAVTVPATTCRGAVIAPRPPRSRELVTSVARSEWVLFQRVLVIVCPVETGFPEGSV